MIKAKTIKGDADIEIEGSADQIMAELAYINIRIIDRICEKTDTEQKPFLGSLCVAMNTYYDLIGGSEDEQADTDSEQA